MNARASFAPFALLLAFPACGNLSDVRADVLKTAYTPSGELVVFTTAGIKVYDGDLATERTSIRLDDSVMNWLPTSLSLSANGQVAAITYQNKTLLYGIPGGQPLGSITVEPTWAPQHAALSPDGDMLFLYGGANEDPTQPGAIRWVPNAMYRTSDGSRLWEVEYTSPVPRTQYCFVWEDLGPLFSPDGKTLYLGRADQLFAVDTIAQSSRFLLNAHDCIGAMTWLNDGTLLVHRGYANPVDEATDSFAIFNIDGTLVREFPAFTGYIALASIDSLFEPRLACSPDGVTCAMSAFLPATVEPDGSKQFPGNGAALLIWRLDGTLVHSIILPDAYEFAVAFSPDGSRLAVATNGVARVYNVTDATVLAERKYTNEVF